MVAAHRPLFTWEPKKGNWRVCSGTVHIFTYKAEENGVRWTEKCASAWVLASVPGQSSRNTILFGWCWRFLNHTSNLIQYQALWCGYLISQHTSVWSVYRGHGFVQWYWLPPHENGIWLRKGGGTHNNPERNTRYLDAVCLKKRETGFQYQTTQHQSNVKGRFER